MRTQLLFGSLVVSLASLLPGCGEDSGNDNPGTVGTDGMTTSTNPAGGTVAPPATTPGGTVTPAVNPAVTPTMGPVGGTGGMGGTLGGTGGSTGGGATAGMGGTGGAIGGTGGATGGTMGGTGGAMGGTMGGTGGMTGGAGGAIGGGMGGTTDMTGDGTGSTDTMDTTDTMGVADAGAAETTDDMNMGGGEFALTSAELTEGADFPEAHTCSGGQGTMGFGEAISLTWSGAPEETQSFALVMLDVTLTESGGEFASFGYHSGFWNLPTSVTSLPVGSWTTALSGAETYREGYLGPCPVGLAGAPDAPHTYVFTLYAIGEATIDPGQEVNADFIAALEAASVGKTTLSGISCASQMGYQTCDMYTSGM